MVDPFAGVSSAVVRPRAKLVASRMVAKIAGGE
jgi:hypothetical protein